MTRAKKSNEFNGNTQPRDVQIRNGFGTEDLPLIQSKLGRLPERLSRSTRQDSWLEIGVKDRDRISQRVTLEFKSNGRTPRLVATSERSDLTDALNEVRSDMTRQLNDTGKQRIQRHRHVL